MGEEPGKNITCKECGSEFFFLESEEKHLRQNVADGIFDFYSEPKRCKPCRIKKRAAGDPREDSI